MPSVPSTTFDPALLQPSEASLRSSGNTKANGSKLSHAAVEFESVLLGQWLASAQKSFATVPGSEDDEDAGGEQMRGFATQQLAASIAKSGGLGIAKLVQNALEHTQSHAQNHTEPAAPHPLRGNNTEVP